MAKPLEFFTAADLQRLVDNRVQEGRAIEYKSALVVNTDEDKREFLSDVSSFANTSGGHLLFGIEENGGVPTRLLGRLTLAASYRSDSLMCAENLAGIESPRRER